MKIFTRLFLSFTLLLTLLLLSNCKVDAVSGVDPILVGVSPQPSAIEFIEDNPDLTKLDTVMGATGWVQNIMTTDSFTFFAPTNEAFDSVLMNNQANSVNDIPAEVIIELLNYHFVADTGYILRDTFAEFIPTSSISSFGGTNSLFVKTEGSIRINGERKVVLQDVRLQNSVLHLMRKIATPIDLVTIIDAHPELSTLTDLLEREDMESVVNELSGEGPFTIFAPSDSAFIRLFLELEVNSLNGIPSDTLESVLLSHIVPSENLRTESLIPSAQISTLLPNQALTVGITDNILNVSDNNETANLINTDGQGSNGVIHIIDRVILPIN